MASMPSYMDEDDAAMLFFDTVDMNPDDAITYFPPSPPPSSMQQGFLMMPHAPSPSHHMDPISSSASAMPLVTKPPLAKSASLSSSPSSVVKTQKLTAAKQLLSLDEVEREILRHNAHLPPEAKRKMAKAEFKRLKHCETVRQSRVRKKAERKDLRQVNDELEVMLSKALDEFRKRNNWMEFDEDSLRDVMFKKFVHSIYEVRGLRTESADLKDQLMVYDTLGEHFQRLQDDFKIPDYVKFRHSFGTIHFKPLSDDEAREIMVDSHHQATSFFESMRLAGAGNEQEKTMGWTQHQRITSDGRVQFNFTKRIFTIGTEELVEKSWEMYCDFELYHGIYASVQKLEILQTINEDTLLIRRDLQEGVTAPIFRTIFLLFRIKLENGYLICFRSHNPEVYVDDEDDPNVQWMDMFYWLMITDPVDGYDLQHSPPQRGRNDQRRGPPGCDVTFGGNLLNHKSAQHATRWKYQIAMALLRWESNAVAPLFALFG
ncbi:hypothetical protein FI667_g11998, partial [Globisporangium splendens]